MIYLSGCLCLGALVPGGSTVKPRATHSVYDNGDDRRNFESRNFPEIIICPRKHTCPCAHLACSVKICYRYLGWAVTVEKEKWAPERSSSNHRQDNFIFMSGMFKARGCSQLSFSSFPANILSKRQLGWIPLNLARQPESDNNRAAVGRAGRARGSICHPSSHLHVPAFLRLDLPAFTLLHLGQDTRLGTWQAQACARACACVCFLKHL